MTVLTPQTTTALNGHADPMTPDTAVITRIQYEAPDIATYTLSFTDDRVREGYSFLPGQFNMLYLPGIGEAAISISSDPGLPEL